MSTNAVNDVNRTFVDRDKMPVPSTGIFDSPYYVKKVNADWFKHISGIVQGLAENSAWFGNDDQLKRAIDEIHAFLSKDWEVIENCDQVNDCIGLDSAVIAAINQNISNAYYQTLISNEMQYNTQGANNVEQFESVSNVYYYNTAAPKGFAVVGDQTSINKFCNGVWVWLQVWRQRYNGLLDAQIILASAGEIISTSTATLWSFLENIGTTSGIPVMSLGFGMSAKAFDGEKTEFQALKDAYNTDSDYEFIICELQKLLAYNSIGYSQYQNALNQLPQKATSPAQTLIAESLDLQLGDNRDAWLYLVDVMAESQNVIAGGDDCDCVPAAPCTGTNVGYYPDATGIDFSNTQEILWFNDSAYINPANVVDNALYMVWSDWFEVQLDVNRCIRSIMYSIRSSAGGTGIPVADIFVNGVQTRTSAPIYSVAGQIEHNKEVTVTAAGNSNLRGGLLTFSFGGTNAITRAIQIWNIRIKYYE